MIYDVLDALASILLMAGWFTLGLFFVLALEG